MQGRKEITLKNEFENCLLSYNTPFNNSQIRYKTVLLFLNIYLAVHRITDAPFFAEGIHLLHDGEGFGVGHHRGFEETGLDASFAFKNLVFVASNHFDGAVVGGDEFVIAPYLYPSGTIDVIDADIAFGNDDNAKTVVETECSRLEVGHLAVGIGE